LHEYHIFTSSNNVGREMAKKSNETLSSYVSLTVMLYLFLKLVNILISVLFLFKIYPAKYN
jgi:hypothetical protein